MHSFLKLIFWNKTTCFGQFLGPSSGVFRCTRGNGICHTGYIYSLRAGSGRISVLMLLASCPKRVEFYSKNKFEKLLQLVGFILRIHYKGRSPERLILCH